MEPPTMIMNEDDARKKLCPMTFNGEQHSPCIADRCALWETVETKFENFVIPSGATTTTCPPGDGWRMREWGGQIMWSRPIGIAGYCGLLKK